ncbi:amidohydrolase family protein [Pseudodesulfovibrio cashew]|uniref:Amidohydrolase family protein n=1 Tax=Pseudodesulfovibrio cashew TaxID=2678688 RepID=A0A6I6JC22_9BACT|nr:D-aminoacylase [Pseudodesulfovibrio cashew]QGY38679.1 amidohydrolase family protein [Pseudodesulfovibrio cashew]
MSIRIDNAQIIDGTGAPAYPGSILIEGELIIAVGDVRAEAARVIDAGGNVVCPGFIDTHSHSDLVVMEQPFIWPKIRQGVTTEILGQDGISMAPLPEAHIPAWRKNLAGLEGESDTLDWRYATTGGYLDALERSGVGTNMAYLVPHGNVRMEAMGLDDRKASDADLETMGDILRREFEAGGFGLSTGLIYPPCTYADKREMEALCTVAAEYGRPLVIHQRSEADTILESMAEVLDIGRKTGVHVHFSHFKVCGKNNADKFEPVMALLDQAAAEGLRVTFDQYPYVAGSTMLGAILPPWAHAGGTERLLERLADSEARARMLHDIKHGIDGWDNFVAFAGLDGIFVTSVRTEANADTIGKTLTEIGAMRGKPGLEAALDLMLQEENAVGMVDFYGLEEHVMAIMSRPEMNACTDGLLGGTPHPRTFGAFPRILGKYVREEKVMSLEEAVRKMTGKPAETFAIEKRGILKPGNFADVVIFDPKTVRDKGTYTNPARHPSGIELVMVNGSVVHGRETTETPCGKVLRLGLERPVFA